MSEPYFLLVFSKVIKFLRMRKFRKILNRKIFMHAYWFIFECNAIAEITNVEYNLVPLIRIKSHKIGAAETIRYTGIVRSALQSTLMMDFINHVNNYGILHNT
jgi:hypothetical protein